MRSVCYLPQLLTVFVVSAAAASQSPWGFPFERQFTVQSLNGRSYAAHAPTLTVTRASQQDALQGAGSAGCNRWNGRITVNQNEFVVGHVGTTKMFCADQMVDESNFLNALNSVKHWHVDGAKLVLEGDRTTLTLLPTQGR